MAETRAWYVLLDPAEQPEAAARRRDLAHEATRRLDALDALRQRDPSDSELVSSLRAALPRHPPPHAAGLADARTVLTWLLPLWTTREGAAASEVLGETPPRRFAALVQDGREDPVSVTGDDPDRWVHLHGYGDGHRDLFWDPEAPHGLRILETDNSSHAVVTREWSSARAFLLEWFLPQFVANHRRTLGAELRDAGLLGGALAPLIVIGALVVGTVILIGLALRACGGA